MITSTLIFDLDGTISDPSAGIGNCLNFALREHQFSAVRADQVANAIGPPLDETFFKFSPRTDRATIASLVAKYRDRYGEVGYAENELYPGMAEAIATLLARHFDLGVCTSKREDFARRILQMFGLHDCFRFIDGGDVGIKKSEQLARLLAAKCIDDGAVMIGDRAVDIDAAKANGLRSVGVVWGFAVPAELEAAEPDTIVQRPDELLQLFVLDER